MELFGKGFAEKRHPMFVGDYELNFKNCHFRGVDHRKCCAGGHFGDDFGFGHLYTITRSDKEERTYDEPYSGELPRRSWLCCPGSQQHPEGDQPPLLESIKTPSTPGDAVTKAPTHAFCSGTCVCIFFLFIDLYMLKN